MAKRVKRRDLRLRRGEGRSRVYVKHPSVLATVVEGLVKRYEGQRAASRATGTDPRFLRRLLAGTSRTISRENAELLKRAVTGTDLEADFMVSIAEEEHANLFSRYHNWLVARTGSAEWSIPWVRAYRVPLPTLRDLRRRNLIDWLRKNLSGTADPFENRLRDHGFDPDGGRGQLAWDRVLAPFLDAEEVTPPVEVTFDEMKQHQEKLRVVIALGMSREILVLPSPASVRVPEVISAEHDSEIFRWALESYILARANKSEGTEPPD